MDQKTTVEVSTSSSPPPQKDTEKHLSSAVVVVRTINASGHVQELDRKFGVWSICSIAIAVDNAWAAGSGSLVRIYSPVSPCTVPARNQRVILSRSLRFPTVVDRGFSMSCSAPRQMTARRAVAYFV
ncbi:MAG: hypothetical protein Q9160_002889 [Pyrenula sp. 1 TL-2023]